MVFKLIYRPGVDKDLSIDYVDVDTFAELFAAVECRIHSDPCKLCTILGDDSKSIGYGGTPDGVKLELF
jgi:hypothetical protein